MLLYNVRSLLAKDGKDADALEQNSNGLTMIYGT
jgi:hypothetical protein